jgi:hypothetical protein
MLIRISIAWHLERTPVIGIEDMMHCRLRYQSRLYTAMWSFEVGTVRWEVRPTLVSQPDAGCACSPKFRPGLHLVAMITDVSAILTIKMTITHVVLFPDVELLTVLRQPKLLLFRHLQTLGQRH